MPTPEEIAEAARLAAESAAAAERARIEAERQNMVRGNTNNFNDNKGAKSSEDTEKK